MRKRTVVCATGVLLAILACGGVVPSSVGPFAASVAEYQAGELGMDCPAYNIGDTLAIGGFSMRITKVSAAEPDPDLGRMHISEKRAAGAENVQGLIIEYEMKNDSPIKVERNVAMSIRTTDGEQVLSLPIHTQTIRDEMKLEEQPALYPPNKWIKNLWIVAADKDAIDGAAAYVTHETEEPDPRDPKGRRTMIVIHEQAVVDLGTPQPAPPINPEKR